MNIAALFNEIDLARNIWQELYNLIKEGQYPTDQDRPSVGGQTVEAFHMRTLAVFEALASLRPTDDRSVDASIILSRGSDLRAPVQSFTAHAKSTLETLKNSWRDGAILQDGNNNFLFQLNVDGGTVLNFDGSGNFNEQNNSLNKLLTQVALLRALCHTTGLGDLAERAQKFAELTRDVTVLKKQARKDANDAEASSTAAAASQQALENAVAQADVSVSRLAAVLQQAQSDVGSVTALVEKIKLISGDAETLEAQVAEYQNTFESFQRQLESRNERFLKFEEDIAVADKAIIHRESEINRLISASDAMIKGSTTAGLSKSLEDTRQRYENRMNKARLWFAVSVGILVVSALPLAAHLLPGLFGNWIPAIDTKADGSPYAVLGKVILLLPGTWLTAFFTKAYSEFFHLEREYAHKAALAMSVEGFKRQAPKYEEEITAEVFLEIRNNPARVASPEPVSHPLYDVLSKTVGKILNRKDENKQ